MLDLLDCSSLENTTSSLFVPYFFAPTMLKKLLKNKLTVERNSRTLPQQYNVLRPMAFSHGSYLL